MTLTVQAIYENGVLKPIHPVAWPNLIQAVAGCDIIEQCA
jgi:hypothetical protein